MTALTVTTRARSISMRDPKSRMARIVPMRQLGAQGTIRPMHEKVDLAAKLALLDGHWQPGIVGEYNDNKLVVVRVLGEFTWHSHPDTDDFFLVLSGRL